MYKTALSVIMALLLCCGCGGGGEFVADPGPFSGTFVNEAGTSIGAFSFTVFDNVMQGTGLLTHEGSSITVTVNASINGKVVNGTVSNSTFGSGPLWGTFNSIAFAEGGFNFTGNAGQSTTVGTWSAVLP